MKFLTLSLVLFSTSVFAQDATVRARMGAQIAAVIADKNSLTPAQQKLDSRLLRASRVDRGQAQINGVPKLRAPRLKKNLGGQVHVDIDATVTPALLGEIARVGGTVESSFARDNAIRAWLPLAAIEPLAGRNDVEAINAAAEAMTNVGSQNDEADIAHRTNLLRTNFGVDGSGIKVGVLSDSANFLQDSKNSNDLPDDVVVLDDINGGSGEGTAMMELIHDLAPGAKLFFATAFKGASSFANNIRSLAKAGCSVIVDDVTYFNESPFQDGTIAKAVNDVSAQGVLYFSSARNSGNKNDGTSGTWEGDFSDGGDAPADFGSKAKFHQFSAGVTQNRVTSASQERLDLFWADPLKKSKNDYDLYVFDSGGNVVDLSIKLQNGSQDPYESINQLFFDDRVVIVKFKGEGRFLHLDTGRGRLTVSTAGNVRGHNASGAPNAFSVAAVDAENRATPFTTADDVETFSSDGPRRIFFQPNGSPITPGNFSATGGLVLQKPDIAAADGTNTSVPGFESFFGTSAAAPHAAAIAALLRSANPLLSGPQVRTALQTTALDIEAAGTDRDSGFGLLDALGAAQSLNLTGKPNLVPSAFGGRTSPLIVSTSAGTSTDSPVLMSTDTLRVDIGVANTGVVTSSSSSAQLSVDGVATGGSINVNNLAPGVMAGLPDFSIGSLTPGVHTITIRFDTGQAEDETNEEDNEFSKTIVVRGPGVFTLEEATYTGLVQPAPNTTPELGRYGFFTVKVSQSGAFTAKLELGVDKFTLKGVIDAAGEPGFGTSLTPVATLERKEGDDLAFDFTLSSLAAVDEIVGAFTINATPFATLIAKRDVKPAPAGLPGTYTAVIAAQAPGMSPTSFPQGFGYGTAKVSSSGKVRFKGKLPDGYSFSHGASLTDDKTVVFHELTKKASGIVNGLITFRDIAGQSDFDSTLQWVRLPTGKAPAYPAGWPMGINASLFGSLYDRDKGDPALPFLGAPDADGNAVLTLSGTANFSKPSGALLNIDDKGKDKSAYAAVSKFKLSVKAKTGAFSGSFKNPATDDTNKFNGMILDKQSLGAGFFIDGEETGAAVLTAD